MFWMFFTKRTVFIAQKNLLAIGFFSTVIKKNKMSYVALEASLIAVLTESF
jgi:hypothetical protein